MNLNIMRASREKLEETTSAEERAALDTIVVVDHRYPIGSFWISNYIRYWADRWGAHLLRPPKNLGGHGGVTYALEFIRPDPEDIVFVIDPDSYPITRGWMTEMIRSLEKDKSLGSVALMIPRIKERSWNVEGTDPRVGFLMHPEMINMAAYRGKVLTRGFLALSAFYGHMETAMFGHELRLGLRHGYLMDVHEADNPIPHDEAYTVWKREHAAGRFSGNFSEYVLKDRTADETVDEVELRRIYGDIWGAV